MHEIDSARPSRAALRWLMLRGHGTRLGAFWGLWYRLVAQVVRAYLRAGNGDASVYLAGTLASGDLVPGLSDIDVVAVSPGERGAELLRQRRARLHARAPWGARPVTVAVYDEESLVGTVAGSCLTHGFDVSPAGPPAWSLRRSPRASGDSVGLRLRPKVPPAPSNWRLLAGRDCRPPAAVPTGQERRLVAWLELQFWWRRGFEACCRPHALRTPYQCVKLVIEPARIWLWAIEGRETARRAEVLELARRALPEEQEAFDLAERLERSLRRFPDPPLAEVVAFLTRVSRRLARTFAADTAEAGVTEVRLRGAEPTGNGAAPLVDWRARCAPSADEERLFPLPGSNLDPATLAEAARAARDGSQPAIRSDELLVLPNDDEIATLLRAVQCPLTDPVSFALLDGRASASFPNVAGWSAEDCARRAVAEHAAWLDAHGWAPPPTESSRTILLSAARAALFLQSLRGGEPELIVTAAAVAEALDLQAAGMPELHARIASLPAFAAQRARLDRIASPLA